MTFSSPFDVVEVHTEPVSVLEVHSPGPPGPPGVSITGDFDIDGLYVPGDVVKFNNKLYIMIKSGVPTPLPTDQNYWTEFLPAVQIQTKAQGDLPAGIDPLFVHNLNTEDVSVTVKVKLNKSFVNAHWSVVDMNTIQIYIEREELDPDSGTYTVTVLTGM